MRRPDGEKKAYVRLLADYDALDVANKVCWVKLLLSVQLDLHPRHSLFIAHANFSLVIVSCH